MFGIAVLLLFNILLPASDSASYSSCSKSRKSLKLKDSLKFCTYNETVCCDSNDDLRLQKQFEAMTISDPTCAATVKSIICSVCEPSSSQQLNIDIVYGTVPLICNSSVSEELHAPKDTVSTRLCSKLRETCEHASIWNFTFSASEEKRVSKDYDLSSLLMNHSSSNDSFRGAFPGGIGNNREVHSRGKKVSDIAGETPDLPAGVCLERIGNGNHISMIPHPDGSDRVFVHDLQGKIWLVAVPGKGSKHHLNEDETSPFLDITNHVISDDNFGMVSMAFHPNFLQNGRFFVSYYCDKIKQSNCMGRCACNTDVNCDPSKMSADSGLQPCQLHIVIAEYTTNGTSSTRRLAKTATRSEVRRIMTIGLPSRGVHAGQILISPEDGYLYFMLGDNERGKDRRSFAQDKGSVLGKILRLDIDHIPGAKEIHQKGLWGNYSIPTDNPYVNDKELAPEVWALGLRLPWRCSFDAKRRSYFLCGDCGEDQYEEIDLIIKGGNYGWPIYEGPYLYQPEKPPGENTIFPVMGYNHSEVNKKIGSASLAGGFFYWSMTDPCLYGRYLYMDLYGRAMFSAIESKENSGKFTSSLVNFTCAHDSPLQCQSLDGSDDMPDLGYIRSLAQDNRYDIYLLTSSGEYRVTNPSRCSYKCSKQNFAATITPHSPATNSPHSSPTICRQFLMGVQLCISLFLMYCLW